MVNQLSKMDKNVIGMASDHAGFEMKEAIKTRLIKAGYEVKDFGTNKGDVCLVAQVENEIVGAVWVRIMNDYGHVDNEIPSFAISLLKEYRNYGIGTALMKHMLRRLQTEGYKQASLAVQKMNYAVRMYKKVGFEIVDENDEEYIMVCDLKIDIVKYDDKYFEYFRVCKEDCFNFMYRIYWYLNNNMDIIIEKKITAYGGRKIYEISGI